MTLTAIVLAAVLAQPVVQDDPYAVPAEVKNLAFFAGEWTSNGKDSGGNKMVGSSKCSLQFDRWYQWDSLDDLEGFGKINGKFLVTYNSMKKAYEGVWMDSMSPYAMKMWGNFKENTLVMESEKVTLGDMGEMTFRVSYTKVSDKQIDLKVEMGSAGAYSLALSTSYTKK